MTNYKKLNDKAWLDFGKDLLQSKGSEEQKKFLHICKSGKTPFLEYIDEYLLSRENSVIGNDSIGFEYQFTEREFLHPPKDTQKIIWDKFKDIPHEVKSCFGFWGHIILDMARGGYIKPEYWASSLNGIIQTGVYVIDVALKSEDEQKIDGCVRRILRSMCNPAPRGKRILFNDFSLGKSYWRWHWADKMSQHMTLDFKTISEIFDEKYYAVFAAKMHTGKSYLSYRNVLGGLLLYLKQASSSDKKITGEKLETIIDTISCISAWKAIEVQDPELNQKEIEEIAKNVPEK